MKTSARQELLAEFMSTICPCRWIITTPPEHAKKDCPHYTFSAEKELLSAALDRVERETWEKAMECAVKRSPFGGHYTDPLVKEQLESAALAAGHDLSLPTLAERE